MGLRPNLVLSEIVACGSLEAAEWQIRPLQLGFSLYILTTFAAGTC